MRQSFLTQNLVGIIALELSAQSLRIALTLGMVVELKRRELIVSTSPDRCSIDVNLSEVIMEEDAILREGCFQ